MPLKVFCIYSTLDHEASFRFPLTTVGLSLIVPLRFLLVYGEREKERGKGLDDKLRG